MEEGGGGVPSRWRRGGPSSFPLVPESNEVKGVKVSGSRMRARSTAPYGDAGPASAALFTPIFPRAEGDGERREVLANENIFMSSPSGRETAS